MKESFERDDCGRAAQLVGYMYGESAAAERADFERHLRDCAACREELAAFTQVRTSVADFRAELLHAAPAVPLEPFAANAGANSTEARAAHAPNTSPRAEPASRTPHAGFTDVAGPGASAAAAWAALREFFRLSPAWLRVSSAAAAVAVCALAVLAVANAEFTVGDRRFALRADPRPAAPTPAGAPATSPAGSEEAAALQAQLKSVAAERDAAVRELEETREELDDSRAANLVAAEFEIGPAAVGDSPPSREERRARRAPSASSRSGRPSRPTRRAAEDEDLPRLLDLLGDAN